MQIMETGANIVVGAQWGDEGKGLISAYLGAREQVAMVARAGVGPNAEHGVYLRDGKTYIKMNQLPLGWIFNPEAQIRIGSGVCVDPKKLLAEVRRYELYSRVRIDYRCPVIEKRHIDAEKRSKTMQAVGSTFSGSGHCRADWILRKAKQAHEVEELQPYLTDVSAEINAYALKDTVTVESSQGTMLSLAISDDYPNCTSDNVTAPAAMDDVLLNYHNVKDVYLVLKALPTREGSGTFGNSRELSIEEITSNNLNEISSIGGAQRRKASGIDTDLLRYAVDVNGATKIALTFCDHFDPSITGARIVPEITPKVWKLIDAVQEVAQIPVTILNTGKTFDSIIDIEWQNYTDWQKIYESMERISE